MLRPSRFTAMALHHQFSPCCLLHRTKFPHVAPQPVHRHGASPPIFPMLPATSDQISPCCAPAGSPPWRLTTKFPHVAPRPVHRHGASPPIFPMLPATSDQISPCCTPAGSPPWRLTTNFPHVACYIGPNFPMLRPSRLTAMVPHHQFSPCCLLHRTKFPHVVLLRVHRDSASSPNFDVLSGNNVNCPTSLDTLEPLEILLLKLYRR